jgi:hypothetical protein
LRRRSLLVLVAACSTEPAPLLLPLDVHLARIGALPADQRRAVLERMFVDEAAWRRVTVEPYRDHYAELAADRERHARALAAALGRPRAAPIAVRPHFAGEPDLTRGEIAARWAVPTGFQSQIARADGVPLDVVFFRDGDAWRALPAFDRPLDALVRARDPACAAISLEDKRCRELAWDLADAALRTQAARFQRACTRAAALCGKPRP